MPNRLSSLLLKISEEATSREKDKKVSQSFYLSETLLERLRAVLPEGVSLSSVVELVLAQLVTEAEEMKQKQIKSKKPFGSSDNT